MKVTISSKDSVAISLRNSQLKGGFKINRHRFYDFQKELISHQLLFPDNDPSTIDATLKDLKCSANHNVENYMQYINWNFA